MVQSFAVDLDPTTGLHHWTSSQDFRILLEVTHSHLDAIIQLIGFPAIYESCMYQILEEGAE